MFLSYKKIFIVRSDVNKVVQRQKLTTHRPLSHPNPSEVTRVDSLACILPDFSPGRIIFLKYKSQEVTRVLQTLQQPSTEPKIKSEMMTVVQTQCRPEPCLQRKPDLP